jgi:hypothetical protein
MSLGQAAICQTGTSGLQPFRQQQSQRVSAYLHCGTLCTDSRYISLSLHGSVRWDGAAKNHILATNLALIMFDIAITASAYRKATDWRYAVERPPVSAFTSLTQGSHQAKTTGREEPEVEIKEMIRLNMRPPDARDFSAAFAYPASRRSDCNPSCHSAAADR